MKTIRKAVFADLDAILSVYAAARQFMRETGNATQWAGGHPPQQMLEADIAKGTLYICEEADVLLGVFYFAVEDDPTYRRIDGGTWLNTQPFGVIHRIAVAEHARGTGVAGFIFNACYEKHPNLKIDTHRDNLPMQRALEKNGFRRCGIIYLPSGDERVAYQKCAPESAVTVTVDRPMGSRHPQYPDMIYPVNYGYVKGVMGGDGEEQDAYILGVTKPLSTFCGKHIATIRRLDDNEEKWVICPPDRIFTTAEIAEACAFQEQYFHTKILLL